ncbi:hypothetical protein GCM10011365_20540 [Marinicella pacifica]|uniref:Transglutaminase-like domain-containing protein n=1 Tax=Marinicella pacifica TaxID=1171543 RepID=A0A917CUC6_9GAMM|nr:transglutaminase-like domain-containing protein [Marinicella pacifica]GGF99127.1 hypothetical protein GCM10011365_20540 [Marinicella pacifica]
MRIAIFISILAIMATVVFLKYGQRSEIVIEPVWDGVKSIRYGFELKNKGSKLAKDIVFKAYAPVSLTSSQKVKAIKSSHEYLIESDEMGNQLLVYSLPEIPPFGTLNIQITVEIETSDIVAQGYKDDALYFSEQPGIEINNENVMQVANYISNKSHNAPQEIYNWLVENLNYTGYGYTDKGAAYAAEYLEGDCTEYAYLGTAVGRLLSIPSRAVNGYVVVNDAKLNISDYHTWTEMWFDGGWQVMDAQKQNNFDKQSDYIAMSIYNDSFKRKGFQQFWISNNDIKVMMK